MPSAKMESCSSAPPLKMLNSVKTLPSSPWKVCRITSASMPGVAIFAPTRYTASIPRVNRMRRCSSGILPMF